MYNANKSKELEYLPKDSILDGVIIDIKQGMVKDFVYELTNWKGDQDQTAINLIIEISVDKRIVKVEQMFTYKEEDGITVYYQNSNLGKYHKKYGKLPEVGDKVKIITNNDGFGKIKID